MAGVTLLNVSLRGIVCSVPGQPLTALDVGKAFPPEEAARLAKTVGLERLFRAKPGQTTADLCTAAARHLLDKLQWPAESVDGVIVVTQTPDYPLPNTASVVHAALGLGKHVFAFDVAMGCSGFVYGLWMSSQFLSGGAAKRVLLLVGDTLSRATSPLDRSGMLFGDAGSAAALEYDPTAAPSSFVLGSDGTGVPNLMIPGGGYRNRDAAQERIADADGNARAACDVHMNGWEVFNFTAREVPGLIDGILHQHGWSREQVDLFLLHQANKMMIQHLVRKCKLPPEKAPINIHKYGNTSAVTVPLLVADEVAQQLTAGPQQVVLAGFGVGYAWAAAALTLGPLTVAEVINIA